MALKFRKVKRPRRRKRNPGLATSTLLVSGGVALVAVLLIRKMMNSKERPALPAPAKTPPLDMNVPDERQLEDSTLDGIGGIFTGGRGLGSL